MLSEWLAATTVDLEAGAPCVGCAHFESSGEDYAIHLVLYAVEYEAFLADAIDAAAPGIHQRYVWPVERRQILIVEGRTLAELTVPGLQRLCRPLVLHGCVHSRADLVHLL